MLRNAGLSGLPKLACQCYYIKARRTGGILLSVRFWLKQEMRGGRLVPVKSLDAAVVGRL